MSAMQHLTDALTWLERVRAPRTGLRFLADYSCSVWNHHRTWEDAFADARYRARLSGRRVRVYRDAHGCWAHDPSPLQAPAIKETAP